MMTTPQPLSPPPLRDPKSTHLPAYLSNGLLGARVGTIPFTEGLCVVGGLRGLDPADGVEAFARGPYPFAGDIELEGRILSRAPGHARFVEQRYDFSCGELRSRFTFRGDEATATVEVVSLFSRTMPTLALQEIRVTVDQSCELTVVTGLNPAGVLGRPVFRTAGTPGAATPITDGCLLWETHGALGRCGAAYTTSCTGDAERSFAEPGNEQAPLLTRYALDAKPGERYVVQQIASLIPSTMHVQPDRQACRLVNIGRLRGLDALREENRAAWLDIWRGRPVLVGADERWQRMADAAHYYLHASAHPSSLFSTSMFGLAYWPNYHYYHGHVMWDIEAFAFPPLLLTAPDTARALLAYRSERLPAAHRNAAMHGYAGLQFPWESGPGDGSEMTRTDGELLDVEQHGSLSVALAFARYAQVTGDREFLNDTAWPVLSGVAGWVLSRLTETERGLEIKGSIGVAEGRPSPIDNSAYENMMAILALRAADEAARTLGRDRRSWAEAADRVYLPLSERTHILRNHDRFTARESGVNGATPEAPAGFFPGGYVPEPEVEEATLRFALDRVGPYIGYPMLSAPLGVYAAWLGDRQRSADMFEQGYAEFMTEPFWEINEFSSRFPDKPRVGPLFANIGGFLSGLLIGLPGLSFDDGPPEDWARRRVVMPSLWDAVSVERIWVRGRPARLLAEHGAERARLTKTTK